MVDRKLIAAARRALREAGDPEKAPIMQRYAKSALSFYGVQTPEAGGSPDAWRGSGHFPMPRPGARPYSIHGARPGFARSATCDPNKERPEFFASHVGMDPASSLR